MRIQRAKVTDGQRGPWSAPLPDRESRGIIHAMLLRYMPETVEDVLRSDNGMRYTTRDMHGTHSQYYRYAR